MIKASRRYESDVKPRLAALSRLSEDLSDEFELYRYEPRNYHSFHTTIKADYLLAFEKDEISFFFVISDKYSDGFCGCSIFEKGVRDYTENQMYLTVLKKEVKTESDDEWIITYKSSHLHEETDDTGSSDNIKK